MSWLAISAFVLIALQNPCSAVPLVVTSQGPKGLDTVRAGQSLNSKADSKIHFLNEDQQNCNQTALDNCKNVTLSADMICGSDRKTYKSMEELECVRDHCYPDLKIRNLGNCQPRSKKGPSSDRQKKLLIPFTIEELCSPDSCGCNEDFYPICGTDNVTYGNSCLLKCNQKCNPDVQLFHVGYCGKIFFRNSVTNELESEV